MVSLQKLPLSRYKHSETDDIRSKYGAIYGVFYGSILTPRISGGFNACADSVYQALFSAYEKEPGVEAISTVASSSETGIVTVPPPRGSTSSWSVSDRDPVASPSLMIVDVASLGLWATG